MLTNTQDNSLKNKLPIANADSVTIYQYEIQNTYNILPSVSKQMKMWINMKVGKTMQTKEKANKQREMHGLSVSILLATDSILFLKIVKLKIGKLHINP